MSTRQMQPRPRFLSAEWVTQNWRKLNDPGRPDTPRERIERAVKARLKLLLYRAGVPIELQPKVYDERDSSIIAAVQPYTMTSPDRIVALCDAVRYLCRNGIEGAIVECGVWRGGSMMAAAMALAQEGDRSRELYLYDTYEGMTPAGPRDVDFRGRTGAGMMSYHEGDVARAPLDDVKDNLGRTGYPLERCRFVVGKVQDTIPATIPERIALLRLDTDWYESTKHEIEHLLPLVAPGGVLILDDYGEWKGARGAVDEYFDSLEHAPLLNRIDFTGRICVIPETLRPSTVGAGS
jgi:hypothetical protein